MMDELLLFSVEKNVFNSGHDARAVTDDHVTTTRRPVSYSCAGRLPAAIHPMLKRGKMLAFGDVTCRKVSASRTVSFFLVADNSLHRPVWWTSFSRSTVLEMAASVHRALTMVR